MNRREFLRTIGCGAAALALPGCTSFNLKKAASNKADKKLNRKAIYWHYPHFHVESGSRPSGAVRAGDYKLIEWYEDNRIELYNLKNDIGERKDISKKMPRKADELRKMLHCWRKETGAKMPVFNP
jgi:hypothetical protein